MQWNWKLPLTLAVKNWSIKSLNSAWSRKPNLNIQKLIWKQNLNVQKRIWSKIKITIRAIKIIMGTRIKIDERTIKIEWIAQQILKGDVKNRSF